MANDISGNFPTNTYRNIDTQSTGVVIKAAKGQVFALDIYNNAAAARFVKLYDTATTPDNTSIPVATIGMPASSARTIVISTAGAQYLNGIAVRATQLVADNDNTAPAANDVVLNLYWM